MNNKIHILHVVGEMGLGGYENYIMNLFRHINKDKFEFSFLVFKTRRGYFEDEIEANGGKIFHSSFGDDYNIFKLNKFLKKICSEYRFDILHCHNRYYSPFYLPILRKHIKQIIIHSHTANREKTLKGFFVWLLGQYPAKKHFNNVACSKLAGDFVFGKKSNYEIFPNCIETKKFIYNEQISKTIRSEYNIPNDSFVIGHVGRFAPAKNHSFLLELFSLYVVNHPNSYLCLCGEGAEKNKIINYVEHSDRIKNNVIFLNPGMTSSYYSMFDVFCFPSTHEGFPLVLLEAQSSGCPILASDSITKEVDLTNSIVWLNLSNIQAWLKELNCKKTKMERAKDNEVISKSIYDSNQASLQIENYYEKLIKRK